MRSYFNQLMFLQADTELHLSCIIAEDFTDEYDNIDSPDYQLFMADIEDAVCTYYIYSLLMLLWPST